MQDEDGFAAGMPPFPGVGPQGCRAYLGGGGPPAFQPWPGIIARGKEGNAEAFAPFGFAQVKLVAAGKMGQHMPGHRKAAQIMPAARHDRNAAHHFGAMGGGGAREDIAERMAHHMGGPIA